MVLSDRPCGFGRATVPLWALTTSSAKQAKGDGTDHVELL